MTAAILVIVLGLSDGIVDVNRRYFELTVSHHLVEAMYTSGRLFADAVNVVQHLRIFFVNDQCQVAAIV